MTVSVAPASQYPAYRDDPDALQSDSPLAIDDKPSPSPRRFNKKNLLLLVAIAALIPVLYFFLFWAPSRKSTAYQLTPTVKVADYPTELLPASSEGRLIFIGDIHGCNVEFAQLLETVGFEPTQDKLILLGDFISKGPDSIAVLEMAMKYDAACIRGNHENTLLRRYAKKHGQKFDNDVRDRLEDGTKSGDLEHFDDDDDDDGEGATTVVGQSAKKTKRKAGGRHAVHPHGGQKHASAHTEDDDDCMLHEMDDTLESGDFDPSTGGFVHVMADEKKIIKKASPEQIEYIDSCPLILHIPEQIFGPDGGDVAAVHAGLMWDVPTLADQDPAVLLYIRTLLPPNNSTASPSRDGILWKEVWNDYQETLPPSQRRTVVYGHDAKTGLAIKKYSKGLDSRCYKGDYLTAMVAKRDGLGGWKHGFYSVKCQVHDPKLPGYVDGKF
ncbi:Metallo-dependent phosphatase-like protein [Lipomyces orientalis]|uniref:Metallo-dependent phosphatase-like protein n=1 Tax=Lipomyces orientalis TaxID=1233043 RepID=A0ACC3TW42_9ASCO